MRLSFEKYPWIRQMFFYGIIGAISAGLDTLCFLMLRDIGIDLYFSNFIAINLGITLSFFLNSYLNFKRTDKLGKRAFYFYFIGYLGILLSMAILYLGTVLLKVDEITVKITSIFIVAGFQFVLNRLITFNKGKPIDSIENKSTFI